MPIKNLYSSLNTGFLKIVTLCFDASYSREWHLLHWSSELVLRVSQKDSSWRHVMNIVQLSVQLSGMMTLYIKYFCFYLSIC